MIMMNYGNDFFHLLQNVHAYEINIGNYDGFSVVYSETVNNKTIQKNLIADSAERGIKTRNLAGVSGTNPVDLILKYNRESDRYSVFEVEKANSINEDIFAEKVNQYMESKNERKNENPIISSLRHLYDTDMLRNLCDTLANEYNSDLEEARDKYLSVEEFFNSHEGNDLLDFVKYNDISLLQSQRSHDFYISSENNIYSDFEASEDLLDNYGDEILSGLIEAKEQNRLDELNLDCEIEEALEDYLETDKHEQSKGR